MTNYGLVWGFFKPWPKAMLFVIGPSLLKAFPKLDGPSLAQAWDSINILNKFFIKLKLEKKKFKLKMIIRCVIC